MNLYLYAGKDLYRQESSLRQMLDKYGIEKDMTTIIDASDPKTFRIERVLMECDTLSLFDEGKKAVIVKDPYFLKAEAGEKKPKGKGKAKKDSAVSPVISGLEAYLKAPNPNTVLVFQCHGYNADSRKSEYRTLAGYGCEMIQTDVMDEAAFVPYAKKALKDAGYDLDQNAFRILLERCGTDTLLLHHAIEKLDLYGKKKPDETDIRHLVPMSPEINVFNLTSGFTSGDLALALDTAEEMLRAGYDYMALISMLAKRLRIMYNVRRLYESGLDTEQIGFRLHQKKGYVYYVLKDSSSFTSGRLLSLLNALAELDQGIKAGTVAPQAGFEQFLIRNGKR